MATTCSLKKQIEKIIHFCEQNPMCKGDILLVFPKDEITQEQYIHLCEMYCPVDSNVFECAYFTITLLVEEN